MEKLSLLLPASTVELLHIVARHSDRTIGQMVQDMALEQYMHHAMDAGVRALTPDEIDVHQITG